MIKLKLLLSSLSSPSSMRSPPFKAQISPTKWGRAS